MLVLPFWTILFLCLGKVLGYFLPVLLTRLHIEPLDTMGVAASAIKNKARGEKMLFISIVPKFYKNVFLLVGLPTLVTLMNFYLLIH